MKDYMRGLDKETFEQVIKACTDKVEGVSDKDWQDIIEEFGLNIHRDVLRKGFQSPFGGFPIMKYMTEYKINKEEDFEDDLLRKMDEKREELQRERIRINTERSELNRARRVDVRNEMLYEEFKKSLNNIEVPNFKEISIINGKKIGHLGLSDFHFGKHFEVLNNEYNDKIFYDRMNMIANEVLNLCRINGITKLHVLNCGDDVEGMALRVSQIKSLQYGFTDQVIKLAKFMVKFLNRLSEEVEVVYHHVQEGNHSELRTFGDKTWTYENMERIIITYIRDMTENNPRITVPEYKGNFCQYDILGYNIYARHGHRKINENKVIGDVTLQLRKFIDYVYFGHLHHHKRKTVSTGSSNNKEVIYLPSLMGEDEYSEDFLFGGAKASALFEIYEEGKGINGSYNILAN